MNTDYISLMSYMPPEVINSALEKSQPKMPYFKGTLTTRTLHCGSCNGRIFSTDNYCKHCGQKIGGK